MIVEDDDDYDINGDDDDIKDGNDNDDENLKIMAMVIARYTIFYQATIKYNNDNKNR